MRRRHLWRANEESASERHGWSHDQQQAYLVRSLRSGALAERAFAGNSAHVVVGTQGAARRLRAQVGAVITFTLQLRLVSEANAHTHWRARQKRAKSQRALAKLMTGAWRNMIRLEMKGNATVTITRIAPRAIDSDNAVGSAKHVRDGIADALGIDDRDPRIEWVVRQEKGPPKTYAVRIEIAPRE